MNGAAGVVEMAGNIKGKGSTAGLEEESIPIAQLVRFDVEALGDDLSAVGTQCAIG